MATSAAFSFWLEREGRFVDVSICSFEFRFLFTAPTNGLTQYFKSVARVTENYLSVHAELLELVK